jgi:hypothetical protein
MEGNRMTEQEENKVHGLKQRKLFVKMKNICIKS